MVRGGVLAEDRPARTPVGHSLGSMSVMAIFRQPSPLAVFSTESDNFGRAFALIGIRRASPNKAPYRNTHKGGTPVVKKQTTKALVVTLALVSSLALSQF